MNPLSRLFVALGVFLIVVGGIYGVFAREYEGLTLSITVAGGALLIGGYGMTAVRRARAAAAGPAAGEEPHVGPTIWPLVFAISMIGLVIGAVSSRWALLPGTVFLVAACIGWVLDVHRQWHHHVAGHSGGAGHVPAPREADIPHADDGATTGPAASAAGRGAPDGPT